MTLPAVLVRNGSDIVPVLLGESEDGKGFVGFDLVRERVIDVELGDVVGAVSVDPAAVYWGLDLVENEAEQRMAAEPRHGAREASGPTSPEGLAYTFLRGDDKKEVEESDGRIAKIAAAIRALGIDEIGEVLGSGSYGTAAALDDDHVLKITSDPTEVQAGHVLTGKDLTHVAHVDGAWFVRGVRVEVILGWDEDTREEIVRTYPVGVLIAERVQTLSDEQTSELTKTVVAFKYATHTWPHELAKLTRAKQRAKLRQSSADLETLLRATGLELRDEGRVDDAYLAEGIADALKELRDQGVYAIDAHGGNVGYAEAAGGVFYKLFDIGSSSPPSTPKAKYIDKKTAATALDLGFGMLQEGAEEPGWIGEGTDELEPARSRVAEEAPAKRRAPRALPAQGYKFAPIPSPLFGEMPIVTGYTEVRSQLIKHREQLPSLETIQLSTTFAGLTVQTSIVTAEKAFQCVIDKFAARGRVLPNVRDIDDCLIPLGLIGSRRAMYESAGAWAPKVLEAMQRGLRDRELRRHLYLTTELPEHIALAKLSFILALLGQDCACLDARLLTRMYGDEAKAMSSSFSRPPTEGVLARYEAAEDAFLDGNPFYRRSDPIGRARAQWMGWESVGGRPATHSTWLNVVR